MNLGERDSICLQDCQQIIEAVDLPFGKCCVLRGEAVGAAKMGEEPAHMNVFHGKYPLYPAALRRRYSQPVHTGIDLDVHLHFYFLTLQRICIVCINDSLHQIVLFQFRRTSGLCISKDQYLPPDSIFPQPDPLVDGGSGKCLHSDPVQMNCDLKGAMPIRLRLHHSHQPALRGHRLLQNSCIVFQISQIDLCIGPVPAIGALWTGGPPALPKDHCRQTGADGQQAHSQIVKDAVLHQ